MKYRVFHIKLGVFKEGFLTHVWIYSRNLFWILFLIKITYFWNFKNLPPKSSSLDKTKSPLSFDIFLFNNTPEMVKSNSVKISKIRHSIFYLSLQSLWLLSLSMFFERQINNWMSNCRDFDWIRLYHFWCFIK